MGEERERRAEGWEGSAAEERVEVEEGPRPFCPLFSIAFGSLYQCLEDRCMWWDVEEGCCLVESLKHIIWRAAGEIAGA